MEESAVPPPTPSKTPTDLEGENVPLRFVIPTGMVSRYAHHMLAQATDNEITLSFFEPKPPLVLGGPEEQIEAIRQSGVLAECVARVTIAKARFPEFVKALSGMPTE